MKPFTPAYASKSSNDQATRSRKSLFGRHLSWWEVVAVIIVSSLVFYFGSQYPLVTGVIGCVVSAAAAVVLVSFLFLLCRALLRVWRHPASRIARLLKKGRAEEACATGSKLLLKYPHDPMLRFNVAVALELAGKLNDARQVFDAIDAEALPPQLTPFYEDRRRKLHPENET